MTLLNNLKIIITLNLKSYNEMLFRYLLTIKYNHFISNSTYHDAYTYSHCERIYHSTINKNLRFNCAIRKDLNQCRKLYKIRIITETASSLYLS